METEKNADNSIESLILSGPVMTDEQHSEFLEMRKSPRAGFIKKGTFVTSDDFNEPLEDFTAM